MMGQARKKRSGSMMSVKSHLSPGPNYRLPEGRPSNAGMVGNINLPSPENNRTYLYENLVGECSHLYQDYPV